MSSRSVTVRLLDSQRGVSDRYGVRLASDPQSLAGGCRRHSPSGTGQISIIADHLSYFMVHINPGKSVP